jgi:hypothetical protein
MGEICGVGSVFDAALSRSKLGVWFTLNSRGRLATMRPAAKALDKVQILRKS